VFAWGSPVFTGSVGRAQHATPRAPLRISPCCDHSTSPERRTGQCAWLQSTVYGDLSAPAKGHVRADLGLEYDLLVVSAADYGTDDPLFKAGTSAFDDGDPTKEAAALAADPESVLKYVT